MTEVRTYPWDNFLFISRSSRRDLRPGGRTPSDVPFSYFWSLLATSDPIGTSRPAYRGARTLGVRSLVHPTNISSSLYDSGDMAP
jgi:hypothetical protein